MKETKMRDLVFKNLTSYPKKRRILASSEIVDQEGMRSVIHRHFVCVIKEVKARGAHRPAPYLYVLKEHNAKEQKERFFCRLKSSMYLTTNGKTFLVLFMHSLKIHLSPLGIS
jgi:hypothetical protein